MSTRLSKKERQELQEMDLEGLASSIARMTLPAVGKNSKLLISEIALRLEVPADAVALVVARKDKHDTCLYHWSNYVAERVEELKNHERRKWNGTVKCNTFTVTDEELASFMAFNNGLFDKTLIIEDRSYRVEKGESGSAWDENLLYEISDDTHTVNLGDVLRGFASLRLNDQPSNIAVHGEVDSSYRTGFSASLKTDLSELDALEFRTRHPLLLFSIRVTHGQLRYLLYSAAENVPVGVYFGEAKDTRRLLARFKETQARLAYPLIEDDQEVFQMKAA